MRTRRLAAIVVMAAALVFGDPGRPASAVDVITGVCILDLAVELDVRDPELLGDEVAHITTPGAGPCVTEQGNGSGRLTADADGRWLCTGVGAGIDNAGALGVSVNGVPFGMPGLVVRVENLGGAVSITATKVEAGTVVAQGFFVQTPDSVADSCLDGEPATVTWSGTLAFVDPTIE